MKILMFTNTFTPHVGGVARSVQQFARQYRELNHQVLTVAPVFDSAPDDEDDVIRIPAIQHFNGSDFSVPVPVPGFLSDEIEKFDPDIVHSHHPFLLGDSALRISASYDIPVVFTHHTQYERYTHYVPGDSHALKRFVIELAVGYCNLCDAVIAPSDTIRQRLREQGVTSEIVEIPTGVEVDRFKNGIGSRARQKYEIDSSSFVVGHVGRLAPEKGLEFLAECVAQFVAENSNTVFLVAGTGPSEESIRQAFRQHEISDRLILVGNLERSDLADVYQAMNVFAFASQSETQGMVLTEAMAAGTPVVAVDAPGVREVLRNDVNGIRVDQQCKSDFVAALNEFYRSSPDSIESLVAGAHTTAAEFSIQNTAENAVQLYKRLIERRRNQHHAHGFWSDTIRRIGEEWKIWSNVADAAGEAMLGETKVPR